MKQKEETENSIKKGWQIYLRKIEGKIQYEKSEKEIENIVNVINELLIEEKYIVLKNSDNKYVPDSKEKINYNCVKQDVPIDFQDYFNEKNIVYLKLAKSKCHNQKRHVVVVGRSNDISYNDSHTSSKILNYAGGKWDKGLVLIFPIIKNNKEKVAIDDVSKLETEIGNKLIDNGIPIIDIVSHYYY